MKTASEMTYTVSGGALKVYSVSMSVDRRIIDWQERYLDIYLFYVYRLAQRRHHSRRWCTNPPWQIKDGV